jgi:outer membrane phospholipase A
MSLPFSFSTLGARIVATLAITFFCCSAAAGIQYKLEQAHAVAGETINIRGVLFNDTDTAMNWTAPKTLVLQWRNERGHAIRTLAYLESDGAQVTLPVNNFVKFSWRATVPSQVNGLQAVNIEGESTLMALDTNPREKGLIASTVASVPVVDAGAGRHGHPDPALPANVVAAAGAPMEQGPAVNDAQGSITPPTAFENFRNAISPHESTYFDIGNKGGRNARYQVSFKYRLFTPKDPATPDFIDNLYLGYTQTALWDLHSDSHPFYDTTYSPSLFWRKDALWQSPEKQVFLGLAAGVEHASNGKSGDDSRSLNDVFVQPEFNYRFDNGSTLTFAPRVKSYFKTGNNPDYADYAGHVDWKLRWAQDNGLALGGMYRQGHHGRASTQIDASWPLRRTFLNMNGYLHVQYFRGYGETLLGYRQKSEPQVRIGLALVP